MTKHFVLKIDPSNKWEKATLSHPLTYEKADLAKLAAEAIGNQPGNYLISVAIEVAVIEVTPIPEMEEQAA